MQIFSIKDLKVNSFSTPFFKTHQAQAIREFQQVVNDENTIISKHLIDFELWHLGKFEENEGTFQQTKKPICTAIAMSEKENNK